MGDLMPLNIQRDCYYCGDGFTTSADGPAKACAKCGPVAAQAQRDVLNQLREAVEAEPTGDWRAILALIDKAKP